MRYELVISSDVQDVTNRFVGYIVYDDDGKELGHVTYDQKNKRVARMVPDTLYFMAGFEESLPKLVSLANDHFEHKVETFSIYNGHGEIVEVMEVDAFHSTERFNAKVKIGDTEVVGVLLPAVDVEANKAYNEQFEAASDWNSLQTQVTWDWAKPGVRAMVDYYDNGYSIRSGHDIEFATSKVTVETEQRETWVKRDNI